MSPCGSGTCCMVLIRLGSFDPCDPSTGLSRRGRHGARRAPTVAGVRHGARGIRLLNPSQVKPSEWFVRSCGRGPPSWVTWDAAAPARWPERAIWSVSLSDTAAHQSDQMQSQSRPQG